MIKAAFALVRKRGLRELTLREVARKIGVTHAAPYHHFKDRDALLSAMAEEAFGELDLVMFQSGGGAKAAPLGAEGQGSFQHLVDAIMRCQAAGVAPPGDAFALALSAWSLVHGFALLWVEGPLEAMEPYTASFESLRDGMLNNFSTWLRAAAQSAPRDPG